MKKRYIIGIILTFIVILSIVFIAPKFTKPNTPLVNNANEIKPVLDKNSKISFKDPELDKLIRDKISKPEGDIFVSDMEKITYINIDYKKTPIKDISGLENAYNLGYFSYRYGELASLDPLSSLAKLYYLGMSYSQLSKTPKRFTTKSLTDICFIDTNVSDYSFVSSSPGMTDITITNSGATSIDFATNMKELEEINISDNKIKDISPLENKTKLKIAIFHQNMISDLSPIATSTALEEIDISYNNISNLKPLFNLPRLQNITAYEMMDKKIIDRGQIQQFIDNGVEVSYHR